MEHRWLWLIHAAPTFLLSLFFLKYLAKVEALKDIFLAMEVFSCPGYTSSLYLSSGCECLAIYVWLIANNYFFSQRDRQFGTIRIMSCTSRPSWQANGGKMAGTGYERAFCKCSWAPWQKITICPCICSKKFEEKRLYSAGQVYSEEWGLHPYVIWHYLMRAMFCENSLSFFYNNWSYQGLLFVYPVGLLSTDINLKLCLLFFVSFSAYFILFRIYSCCLSDPLWYQS